MDVFPAIDLRGGKCVRLYQGDYSKEQVFSDDPVATAQRWEREGAHFLHVVDLDGAASGNPANLEAIQRITKETDLWVEVGGGIRSLETAQRVLGFGAKRIVLGTVAVENPTLAGRILKTLGPEHVAVGVDAREGKVAVKGWKETSAVDALTLMSDMTKQGARTFIYTDIGRDGTMTEPNFDALHEAARRFPKGIIASGGVSKTEHVSRLAGLGVSGCIIGRAIYTGDIKLPEALAAAQQKQR